MARNFRSEDGKRLIRALAAFQRMPMEDRSPGSAAYGKAFENWVFHELSAYLGCMRIEAGLSYWRRAGGSEVDFVVGDMEIALEAKSSRNVAREHLKGLGSLAKDHPSVRRRAVVCCELRRRRTSDGIDIVPAGEFAAGFWEGEWT